MMKNLENRWSTYCQLSVKRALSTLKKKNYDYRGMMFRIKNMENLIDSCLNTKASDLTNKQIDKLKEYIILLRKKEKFEKNAIYSQGICDSFSIVEIFR